MGKLLDPKITVDNIEIEIDSGNQDAADNIIGMWGPTVPIVKINDYVLNIGEVRSYTVKVHINTVPQIQMELDDTSYRIRKALKETEIDLMTVFVGNKDMYHKYGAIVRSVNSDAGDNLISISAEIFNPKFHDSTQKSYLDTSVQDILADLCTLSDMGLFTTDNQSLSATIPLTVNPDKRYLEFFDEVVGRYTDNMWCYDNFYFMHVANISSLRTKPLDKYTYRNTKRFDSPQDIVITTLPVDDPNLDFTDPDYVDYKLKGRYYTINSNIGDVHLKNRKVYKHNSETVSDTDIGLGGETFNDWEPWEPLIKPFYRERVNKDIAGKSMVLEMEDVLYEVTPFAVVQVDVFFPRDGDQVQDYVKDEENSGKKIVIGYSMQYNSSSTENRNATIQQTIEVI